MIYAMNKYSCSLPTYHKSERVYYINHFPAGGLCALICFLCGRICTDVHIDITHSGPLQQQKCV